MDIGSFYEERNRKPGNLYSVQMWDRQEEGRDIRKDNGLAHSLPSAWRRGGIDSEGAVEEAVWGPWSFSIPLCWIHLC